MKRILLVSSHFAKYLFETSKGNNHGNVAVTMVLSAANVNAELSVGERLELSSSSASLLDYGTLRRPISVVRAVWTLMRLTKTLKPHVVHAHESSVDSLQLWLLFLVWRPMILTVHDVRTHLVRNSSRPRRQRLYTALLRYKASKIIVHGSYLKQDLLKWATTPRVLTKNFESKIEVIHHPPFFPENAETRAAAGVVYPGLSRPITVLFFGRMEYYKGLHILKESIQLVRKEASAIEFVIAGRGPELQHLKGDLLKLSGVEVRDYYIDSAQVENLFHACDVVVTPYIEGSQSGVLAYALGFGKAIVSTKVGSLPEMAQDGINALLVESGDAKALAVALLRLERDREELQRLASGSLSLAQGRLGILALQQRMSLIYNATY